MRRQSHIPRRRAGNVVPFRRPVERRADSQGRLSFIAALIVMPLAAFSAVLFWEGPPGAAAMPLALSAPSDTEHARFSRCSGPIRYNCVVDGDTIWYEGTKIRLADINAPELGEPKCAYEARLAERATERLTVLLNAGNFSLGSADRAHDKYGRELKVIRRNGRSIGGQLVSEGLAESWQGYRRGWC